MKRSVQKGFLFSLLSLPAWVLLARGFWGELGVNPVETLTEKTGQWSLRYLLLVLAVTPLRQYFNWTWLVPLRRMIGLFAYFYATIHLSLFLFLDHFFDWSAILDDVWERPFVTAGFMAWLVMLPLAITSTNNWMRKLGEKWKSLHRMVYFAATLALIHLWWLVKADYLEFILYGLIGIFLLGIRLFRKQLNKLTTDHQA